MLGSLLACGFYGMLSLFEYHTVNPGQDFNEWEAKMGPGSWDSAMHRPSFSDTTTLDKPQSPHTTSHRPSRLSHIDNMTGEGQSAVQGHEQV